VCQAKDNEQGHVSNKRTYTVEEIAELLGIGRTSAYALVKEGHLFLLI